MPKKPKVNHLAYGSHENILAAHRFLLHREEGTPVTPLLVRAKLGVDLSTASQIIKAGRLAGLVSGTGKKLVAASRLYTDEFRDSMNAAARQQVLDVEAKMRGGIK